MTTENPTEQTFDLFHAIHIEKSHFEMHEFLDKKAGYYVTICGATLAFVLHQEYPIVMGIPAQWTPRFAMLLLSLLALVIAVAASFLCMVPRRSRQGTKNSSFLVNELSGTAADYAAKVRQLSPRDRVDEVLQHAHDLARITDRKVRLVRFAACAAVFGLALAVLVVATAAHAGH
jgi:hypothetical protein